MRYKITFENLDESAVNILASALSARPWAEVDRFMCELMKQVQEQEHAAAAGKATAALKPADAHSIEDA